MREWKWQNECECQRLRGNGWDLQTQTKNRTVLQLYAQMEWFFQCLWQAYEMWFVAKQLYASESSETHSCYNLFVGVMQLNNAIRN